MMFYNRRFVKTKILKSRQIFLQLFSRGGILPVRFRFPWRYLQAEKYNIS